MSKNSLTKVNLRTEKENDHIVTEDRAIHDVLDFFFFFLVPFEIAVSHKV